MATSGSIPQESSREPQLEQIENEAAQLHGRLTDLEGRLRRFKHDLIGDREANSPEVQGERSTPQSFTAAMNHNLSDCHEVACRIETTIASLERELGTE